MDFDKIKTADQLIGELVVTDPKTGKPSDVRLTLASAESTVYRSAVRKMQSKTLDSKSLATVASEEQLDADVVELMALCTLGWKGVQRSGKDVPFSHKEAVKLYTEHIWLLNRADQFVHNRVAFFQD